MLPTLPTLQAICHVGEITAIYVVGTTNHFLHNRVSAYSNGIFMPGGGQGGAWGGSAGSLPSTAWSRATWTTTASGSGST